MKSPFLRALLLFSGVFSIAFLAHGGAEVNAGEIEFNRDIRPILAQNCFTCHGADSASRKAGLRLDHFEDATAPRKDSMPPITPGKPDASELVRRIFTTDEDDHMPPPESKKTLTEAQKNLLKNWISQGAVYQAHWALLPPQRSALPQVKNRKWAVNPIDQFILARLEAEKLKPAPEADRRTLARRASLDLTGLPPTPEEVEEFVKDKSSNAYERFIDRKLASPQWGEHRARYWLDAARYGDTHGIHIDNFREMWAYRDWVIKAFNRNQPFDQFTVEQLAGDLLPNYSLDQEIASGFNRCNITTSEGGAIDEEYLVLYARDRTEATSAVWLGLTTGCAVCHDHKFDPISQKEFYSLSAFFNNTTQKAMDGNVKDTPPIAVVPRDEDREKWKTLSPRIKDAEKKIELRKANGHTDFEAWLPTTSAKMFSARMPQEKPVLRAVLNDSKTNLLKFTVRGERRQLTLASNVISRVGVIAGKALVIDTNVVPQIADAGDFEKDQKFSFGAWVYLEKDREGALFARMDDTNSFRGWDFWIEGGKPGTHIVSKWPEDALKVVSKKAIQDKRWTHVFITYDGSAKASGVKIYLDGEVQEVEIPTDKLQNSIRTTVPLKLGQRHTTAQLEKAGIQDLRLYERSLKPEEVKSLARDSRMAYLLSKPAAQRGKKTNEELYDRWLTDIDPQFQKVKTSLADVEKEGGEIKARGAITHVMHERDQPAEAYLLSRGEYDKRKDKVTPNTPAALPPMPSELPRNRLGFAKWLLLPENPLTTRVTVNRFWQEVFGTGIVRTTGDLGVSGELPSHQELLDWMAVEFRESGWDVKKFYKMLVMSATYRQSAAVTAEKLEKDPSNRLLSRGPRFRMDAEMVRDYALASSGLLVPKIGGPSVKPYQPDGVWESVAMIGSNTRDYKRDSGESLYRRSLYTFWKRAAPPALMDIFNAPSRETCTVRRERTNTPLQALATLNDVQFVEAARHLAERAMKEAKEEERLNFMARRLLARPLKSDERKIVGSNFQDLLAHYKSDVKDAEALVAVGESKADATLEKPLLAAYTMVANEMMNLDEVLNK